METKSGNSRVSTLIGIAFWFGIVAGLVEGAGLLLFQRLNSARWGLMLHVSGDILWISPLADVCLFLVVALLIAIPWKLGLKIPGVRVTVFFLTFLTIYDWLTLTARLSRGSCLILSLGVAVAFTRWFGSHSENALRFWRKTFPLALGLALIAFIAIHGAKQWREDRAIAKLPVPSTDAPNVLVIILDTLRADHLSSYGYSRATSPTLDRLASQGVLFESAISPSSWSFPSHVSLVTGRYEFEHGLGDVPQMHVFGSADLGGFPTVGETLEQHGYRTAAFSGNRIFFSSDLGFGRGFFHFEDYFHSVGDMFIRTLYGKEFARMYLLRSEKSKVIRLIRWLKWDSLLDQDAEGSGSYGGAFGIRKRATTVNEEFLRWADRDRQRPFFVFLNYYDIHSPYRTPKGYPAPAWPQETLVDHYDSGIKYADDCVGQLMQELAQRGLTENTLVVITSDHGESLNEHGLATHGGALYRGEIHVPLIFWYPKQIPAGVRIPQPVSNVSVAATVLETLGIDAARFPEPGLTAFWKNPQHAAAWPEPLAELAKREYPGKDNKTTAVPTSYTGSMESMVTPRWHLITHTKFGTQLYDWAQDPGENHNLADSAEGKVAGQELESRLRSRLNGKRTPDKPPKQ